MPVTEDSGLRELLSMSPVAVIGCSTTPGKAAHDVPAYLQDHGYGVIPVNPFADRVLGERSYDSLEEVPERIELVDVFRPSEEVEGIVDQVIARRNERHDVRGIWLQLGITDDESLKTAEDAGLLTTQDRCMKIEHGRLLG